MDEVFALINEMSPYLLLGFLLAGLMHAFIPGMVYNRYLSGKGFRSVLYGALFGIPLPLCSCGVIPTAMSLRKQGASKGATVSFLIATPETGVDSIIATYSLLGLPFAIIRPIAACCNALLGGCFVNILDDDTTVQEVSEEDTHCSCGHDHDSHPTTFWGKIREALTFGFVEMMEDIGKWLVIGLIIAGLITVFVPDSFFTVFKGNPIASMALTLCIAIPMYICATGSIPIAVALMLKGLTPGAALVLLMAGPACNMASILVIRKVLGNRTLLTYLASIITMAICWGCIIDYVLPAEWFSQGLMSVSCCHEETSSWFSIGCTILLALLLINAFVQSRRHPHCHCHDEHHDHHHEHHDHCCCHEEHDHCHDDDDHCACKDDHCHRPNALHIIIKGMHCNHCKANCERTLFAIPGVETVDIDRPSGSCDITLASGTKAEDILPRIQKDLSDLGFTVEI